MANIINIKSIKMGIIIATATFVCGCSRYIKTDTGHKYKVSAKEYRIEKWCEDVSEQIINQLGARNMTDSLFNLILAREDNEKTNFLFDSIFRLVDSVYEIKYVNQDTIGGSNRFKAVFSKPLQHAITDYSSYQNFKSYGQIWIVFYKKDNFHYFYLMLGPTLDMNASGYALYDNRIQIAIFDHDRLAKQVIAMKKLKKYPYNKYRPIGEFGEMSYDGPLDVYKILGKDSIEFIGRGYLDKERNFHPETRQAN